MKVYSTRQAAQKLGISFPTLNRYIGDKKIPVPRVTELGTARVRVWTEADIERVRKILPKIANGRKTRYRGKQSALSNQQSAKAKKKK
jgi:predicted DNA-binding transcriptional regulator AlpA